MSQTKNWEMLDEAQALQSSVVVAFDDRGFDAETRPVLDEMLRAWAQALKEKHPGQLVMSSLLEASIDVARMELQQEALACKNPCMAVPLLPHRWLILARADVLREIGRDELVRSAHERAMQHARREGRPHNADVLNAYENRRLQEHA